MRRVVQIKNLSPRVALRPGAGASRRSFPAWIDAADESVVVSVRTPEPRVRCALVLRPVPATRPHRTRAQNHVAQPR